MSKVYKIEELFIKTRQWAYDRNLIEGSDSKSQMLKLMEEVGELADAIGKKNDYEVRDAIGDIVVVLTILAEQNGFSIERCFAQAYDQIKNRKGRMVDGIFIKESE